MRNEQVTVFGGTGYLGQRIVCRLGQAGYRVRVAVRHPRTTLFKNMGDAAEQVQADVTDESAVTRAIRGSDATVNAVGLYIEKNATSFDTVHVEGAHAVAQQSVAATARLVHISGIGVDADSSSRYVRARAVGEQRVRKAASNAVILRPSVLFGHNDAFLRTLLNLIDYLPIVPLFGSGSTKLQPVHVEDVAEAVVRVLNDTDTQGKVYELGGPRTYTYRELLELLQKTKRRKRLLMPVPFLIWETLATIATLLPNPPLTRDQVILMRDDNTVSAGMNTLLDLGITPKPLEEVAFGGRGDRLSPTPNRNSLTR